jgi:phosphoglycerol transferase
LPYVAFPESGNLEAMGDYDPFRGYLHSATLHWSYATMRGRAQDRADRDLANLPAGQMVPRLRALGFAGIWIDLYGYDPSQRRRVATDFASATASNPLVSGDPDHRFLFYKIAP